MTRQRKRFGQHFLTDDEIARRVVGAASISSQDTVVEIGPGRGALTGHLVACTRDLHLVEIDRELVARLEARFGTSVQVYPEDVLRFDFNQVVSAEPQALTLIGNLPYNISTPLIIVLLGQLDIIGQMVFMLQREVAVRLAASPATRDYGRLSVMVQRHCAIERLFDVLPAAFAPPPKVHSTVVRLTPHAVPRGGPVEDTVFINVVRDAFSMRRKTLRKALKRYQPDAALQRLGIDSGLRAEQLSVEQFVDLANQLATTVRDR